MKKEAEEWKSGFAITGAGPIALTSPLGLPDEVNVRGG